MQLSLPVHLSIHIFFSLLAGFIAWRIWKKPFAAAIFGLAGGFLVDFDHFIDYYLAFGFSWNWDYFKNGYQFLKSDKIYVLFHGWEYVIVFLLTVFLFGNKYFKTIFLSLSLGLFFHLVTDVVVDDVPVRSYSIIYRIENGFELKKLVKPVNYERHLIRKTQVIF